MDSRKDEIAPQAERLERAFFDRPVLQVAQDLLGTRLVCQDGSRRLSGYIVETEAYRGEEDLGCHAKAGLTKRTAVMYGPPGHAYVYFTYGMHWMLNFVTGPEGYPAAVLVRAVFAHEGIDRIAVRRLGRPRSSWADGPGKLCQALAIDKRFNSADLCSTDSTLYLESGIPIPRDSVTTGPRVGLNNVPDPWKSIPWRFRTLDFKDRLRHLYSSK